MVATPRPVGCIIGGVAISVLAAGGLLRQGGSTSQLTVKPWDFAIALRSHSMVGGWSALVRTGDPAYWTFWRTDTPGLMYLALLVPAFIVSPGLLQKIFGARDDRAVRLGVGLNALGLLLYAGVPAVLGIIARLKFPQLENANLALPMVLMYGVPGVVGAIGLAAVFSAEISAADAVLFMLTTSLSQDLYKRFVNPAADDTRVLQVARWTTIVSGAAGVALAITLADVIDR